jgi:hypothetical protein
MTTISDDDGDHINIAIPDYDKAASDELLRGVKTAGFNVGTFLAVLLRSPKPQTQQGNSQTHVQMVSAFLRGSQKVKARDIAELMYSHRLSAPMAASVRKSDNHPASDVVRPASEPMARWGLQQWAVEKVEKVVDQEASEVSSKEGGFHLKDKDASWDFILNFSMSKALSVFELKGPTIFRLLIASAMPEDERPKPQLVDSETAPDSPADSPDSPNSPPSYTYATHFSKAPPADRGKNRRDPFIVSRA